VISHLGLIVNLIRLLQPRCQNMLLV
ncbi:putative membrane protein, partial [Vibrio parahaemolyticus AQ3810]